MTKSELRKMVKECVKEVMAELMLEMNMSQVVENALKKSAVSMPIPKSTMNEQAQKVQAQPKQTPKSNLREQMKIPDSEWNSVYADINPNNPILTESQTAKHNPEFVSEEQLEDTGLLKDYSKFL